MACQDKRQLDDDRHHSVFQKQEEKTIKDYLGIENIPSIEIESR
jgi:hypothetical protein